MATTGLPSYTEKELLMLTKERIEWSRDAGSSLQCFGSIVSLASRRVARPDQPLLCTFPALFAMIDAFFVRDEASL